MTARTLTESQRTNRQLLTSVAQVWYRIALINSLTESDKNAIRKRLQPIRDAKLQMQARAQRLAHGILFLLVVMYGAAVAALVA